MFRDVMTTIENLPYIFAYLVMFSPYNIENFINKRVPEIKPAFTVDFQYLGFNIVVVLIYFYNSLIFCNKIGFLCC